MDAYIHLFLPVRFMFGLVLGVGIYSITAQSGAVVLTSRSYSYMLPPPMGYCVCVCVWLYTRLALFIFSLLSYICEVSSFQNVLSLSLPRMGPHVTRCDSTVARFATI